MSDYKLQMDQPIDVEEILKDLDSYHPRRRGWIWREKAENQAAGPFQYREISEPMKGESVGLMTAHYFDNIDPQPMPTITTEIASGRFEDDIRRMRMAAHHGADHIMVIRTAGQSHFDGLIEGTPQGIGGVPITRKQVRAQRKALDLIEDEVGRPINYHSYVSGVAGPEVAVMFAEEGVNGVHQDPQYNVIYRNINMIRSFVDACESKKLIAWAGMAQIDGAHNANATAREAWKVMPELMVQHAINAAFSASVGIDKKSICLSTVPHCVQIGGRDIDSQERMRMKEAGVTVFPINVIDKLGMNEVIQRAIDIAGNGTAGIHLSFDVDAITPEFAPGTGTVVHNGLTVREAFLAVETLADSGKLLSIDMVEVNPILDERNKTGILASELIQSALGKAVY